MALPYQPYLICSHCECEKSVSAFARDRSRLDGLTYWCRDCRNARARTRHVPASSPGPFGPAPIPARDGDARQARRRVNHLVQTGRLAHPNTLQCTDFGHVHIAGERRHEYDHYLGYAAEHHLHVQPVCTGCHHTREQEQVS